MEREAEKERLYIPVNIATRFEFMPGLGLFETGMGACAGVIAAIFSFLLLELYKGAIVTILTAVTVAVLLRKNEINMSVVDYFRYAIVFSRGQKKYPFRWRHKYMLEDDDEKN